MSQTSSNIIHVLSQLLFVCTHTQHGHVLFARVHMRRVHIRLYLLSFISVQNTGVERMGWEDGNSVP